MRKRLQNPRAAQSGGAVEECRNQRALGGRPVPPCHYHPNFQRQKPVPSTLPPSNWQPSADFSTGPLRQHWPCKVDPSKSAFDNKLCKAHILAARVMCAQAIADAYVDGPEASQALEAVGVLEAFCLKAGAQFYYGVDNDPLGFPGLVVATTLPT